MNYIRGNKRDFDDWEAMGNTGWSYKDVLTYFIKSENNLQTDLVDPGYHGVGGPMYISHFPFYFPLEKDLIKAAREMEQRIGDPNGENQIAFSISQTTSKHGVRFSSARSFLRPVKNRKNLHILLSTLVTKVLIDIETKKAYGVEIVKEDGSKETILTAKEVVLCGGAMGSPKILLHSGVGDETLLRDVGISVVHHLPGVGRNLQNHFGYIVEFTTNQTNDNDLNWTEVMKYVQFRNGAMSTSGNSVIGFIQTKYVNQSENYPDIKFQFGGYQAGCRKTGIIWDVDDVETVGEMPTRKVSMSSVLLRPRSRGYLTIKSNDPISLPKLFSGYFSDSIDIPPIIEGIKFLIKLSKTNALRKYSLELDKTLVKGCEGYPFGSDRYWECAIRRETYTQHHQAGTCKMGPDSDLEAVVDPQLRVKGVHGVRVVDASVMPKVTAGNTLAPIVMIAEKASDMIKQHWLL